MKVKDLSETKWPGWSEGCVVPLQPQAYLLFRRSFAGFARENAEKPGNFELLEEW